MRPTVNILMVLPTGNKMSLSFLDPESAEYVFKALSDYAYKNGHEQPRIHEFATVEIMPE